MFEKNVELFSADPLCCNESLFLSELAVEIKKAGIMLDILIQSLLRP